MNKCSAVTKSGHACTFDAKDGTGYCGTHNPERVKPAPRYKVRRETKAVIFEKPIDSIGSMLKLMAVCTQQAAAGNFSSTTLTAICNACKTQAALVDMMILSKKLAALEKIAQDDLRYKMYTKGLEDYAIE
jgi:hypothetical protein